MGANVTMVESPKGQRRRPFSALWVFLEGNDEAALYFPQACFTYSVTAEFAVCMWSTTSRSWKKNNILESQVSHQHCCGLTDTSEAKLKYGRSAKYFLNTTKSFSLGV